ncbi:MAG: aldo/keto reductase [Eubacteriales bacterium]|nr:aldo/keto reductase [Eubacteriales bacterium]
MQYRKDKYGNELSILGFGLMRLPTKGGKYDLSEATKQIKYAYEMGINYFDTAYSYGDSEAVAGEAIESLGIRDKIHIATKLPQYWVKKPEDFDRFFDEELRRLRTDYVDYYLLHMMNDKKSFERLCELGLLEWLKRKKEAGQIRQVGFSYHGNTDKYIEVLGAFDWELSLVQYNYMDENSQAGRRGVEAAAKKGIPIVIMEPLRGGKLVKLPPKAHRLMEEYHIKRSAPEWSFTWLWDQPEVKVVLSGMNTEEMIRENCEFADSSRVGLITDEDRVLLSKVLDEIYSKLKVGCTGCRYCVPCPKGVDIPGIFTAYNDLYSQGFYQGQKEYFMCTQLRKEPTGASKCIGCGACEKKCPQGIEIRKELKEAEKRFETPIHKVIFKIASKYMKY